MNRIITLISSLFIVCSLLFAAAETATRIVFPTPEEAMKALVDAVRSQDTEKELSILGPKGNEVISSGDKVEDKNNRERFVKSYEEKVNFVKDNNTASVIIGKDDYPMAIPIVKRANGWVFDTEAGLDELLKRRIGRNELNAIKACGAYVQAQKEYADSVRTQDGIIQYARKFCSSSGTRDGLFWNVAEGEPASPLGPFFVAASEEGYTPGEVCMIAPEPYHGYHYRILTAQGANAPGGMYSYIINRHMVAGFALIAWPAEYGSSGIMTFIVDRNGTVYEKNLGPKTAEIARDIKEYDPDPSWSRAE